MGANLRKNEAYLTDQTYKYNSQYLIQGIGKQRANTDHRNIVGGKDINIIQILQVFLYKKESDSRCNKDKNTEITAETEKTFP